MKLCDLCGKVISVEQKLFSIIKGGTYECTFFEINFLRERNPYPRIEDACNFCKIALVLNAAKQANIDLEESLKLITNHLENKREVTN